MLSKEIKALLFVLCCSLYTGLSAAPTLELGPMEDPFRMDVDGYAGQLMVLSVWYLEPATDKPETVSFTLDYNLVQQFSFGPALEPGRPVAGRAIANTHSVEANTQVPGIIKIVVYPSKGLAPLEQGEITAGEIVQIPFYVNYNIPCVNEINNSYDNLVKLANVQLSKHDQITIPHVPSMFKNSIMVRLHCLDSDGDGVADSNDLFPRNDTESKDFDGDGIGDNADLDDDNDGIPDTADLKPYDPSNANEDTDGDGLTDLEEFKLGTDPNNDDEDADGMPDGWEHKHGLKLGVNDAAEDPDLDGLSNLQEYQLGTHPNKADTDNDNVNDGDEVTQGRNPTVNEPAIMNIIQQLLLSD